MTYNVNFKPKAVKDLRSIQKQDAKRIINGIDRLRQNLAGDVKKLTNFSPEYRLRIGNYRILFEIEDKGIIIIYRILHRKETYR